jgi:ribonuclease HI
LITKSYLYEKQLNNKSSEFIDKLRKKNITADIIPFSMRDYMIKIKVNDFGIVNLYYRPTQDIFTIVMQEISNRKKSVIIQKYWDELNGIFHEKVYKNIGYEIDVDGSYRKGITSYGVVVRKNGKIIKILSGILDLSEVHGSHQVAGEIKAVIKAIRWCKSNLLKKVTIYYDYRGLEYWVNGKWKAIKEVSKKYVEFMELCDIKINWVKIKSHTGLLWNEYADKLAGQAIEKYLKNLER